MHCILYKIHIYLSLLQQNTTVLAVELVYCNVSLQKYKFIVTAESSPIQIDEFRHTLLDK